MLDIAKKVTGKQNTSEAIVSFRKILSNLSLSYFNSEPIPANQSNEEAFAKCTSDRTAKKYCPKRWEALQKWFDFSNMVYFSVLITNNNIERTNWTDRVQSDNLRVTLDDVP